MATVEQRVAAIEAVLQGQGSYVSKYSGEEIDALLDGKSLVISGVYASLAALQAAFPSGASGAYQISSTKDLYVWNQATRKWENIGPMQGPAGPAGATFFPSVSDAGVLSWTNNGGMVNPPPVTVKGAGVQSIIRTGGTGAPGTTDTYTITLTDGSKYTFSVYNGSNGVGIRAISKTAGTGAPGTTDTYTITLTDGSKYTFNVYNGAGAAADVPAVLKAASDATAAKNAAESARDQAQTAKKAIEDMTVSAGTLPAGSEATAVKTAVGSSFNIRFGIPRGDQGPPGPQGGQGIQGNPGRDGINGVSVPSNGQWAFNVDENGHLILGYTGEEAPDMYINDDGHLILNIG